MPKDWCFIHVHKDGYKIDGRGGSKIPNEGKDWRSKGTHTFPKGCPKNTNVGLLLGDLSGGTISLDIDCDNLSDVLVAGWKQYIKDPPEHPDGIKGSIELQDVFKKVLKTTRFISSPTRCQFLVKVEGAFAKKVITINKTKFASDPTSKKKNMIEILTNGQQTVIPPSVCSSDGKYTHEPRTWINPPAALQTLKGWEFDLLMNFLIDMFYDAPKHIATIGSATTIVDFAPIGVALKTNIALTLAKSGMFKADDGAGHTYHDEIFHLAVYFKEFCMPEQDCADIITEISDSVRTKDDKPAKDIVHEIYEKGYHITLEIKTDIERYLNVKIGKSKKTLFEKLNKLLTKVSSEYRKLKDKADKAAAAAAAKVMNKDEILETKENLCASILKEEIYWIEEYKKFAMYKDGIFIPNSLHLNQYIREQFDHIQCKVSVKYINEFVSEIRDRKHLSVKLFDQDVNLINMKNGLYCILTKVFQCHDSEYKSLVQSPCRYLPNQKSPPGNFLKYVNSLFDSKKERQRFVQIMKAAVENKFKDRKQFIIIHGVKDSGKGIFLRIISNILGQDNCHAIQQAKMGEGFGSGSLQNKRFVYVSDGSAKVLGPNRTSFLKTITGMDRLNMEKKFQEEINMDCTFTYAEACNRISLLGEEDEFGSFTDRCVFIYLPKQHPNDESNRNFEAAIHAEKDKVISFLLNLKEQPIAQIPLKSPIKTAVEYWRCKSNPGYEYIKDLVSEAIDSVAIYDATEIIQEMETYAIGLKISISSKLLWATLRKIITQYGGSIFRKQFDGIKHQYIKNVNITGSEPVPLDTYLKAIKKTHYEDEY